MKLYRRLFIPDTHAPFHDMRAFRLMLDVAKDFKPHEVVYLGDFFDCYSVSQYDKDPEKNFKLLEEELIEGRELLDLVERTTNADKYVFLSGNHENRIDRYVATYAGKLGGLVKTREILQVPSKYEWLPYGQKGHYRCGKLIATHGSLCNKHVAFGMAAKYGSSVIFGHTHRIQEFNLRNIHGATIKGVTIGWLGDGRKAAEYVNNVADWSHGFAVGYFKPSGGFFLQTIEIQDYQCVFNGRLYVK